MQNNRYQNSYIKGLKRNVINNTIAGIVIAGIIFIIQLIGGCEQPEITHQKTLIDSLQINTNDEINDWDTDTTTYHTSTNNQGGILPEPDISEWETDTTIYHTTTKPTK